jgi:hypothetical protein
MNKWQRATVVLVSIAISAAITIAAVNPPVGSVWTYLGRTLGADWVPNPNIAPTCTSIEAFGGKGDDTTDNTPIWNTAKASSINCISFPAGTFRFNSAISYNFPANTKSLKIAGQGQDVTILHFPNVVGTALTLTLAGMSNSFHLRDLTMTTGTTNADTAIYVVQSKAPVLPRRASGYAASDITRITLRSDEGYWEEDAANIAHGWKTGIHTMTVSVIDFVGVTIYGPKPPTGTYAAAGGTGGTGIDIEGAGGGVYLPVLFNFDRVNINWAETGIVYGPYAQGFQIVSSNIVNCYTGVHVPAGSVDLAQLAINASQFNNIKNIVVESQVPQLIITGNLFYTPDDHASITLTKPTWQGQISNNSFGALTLHLGTGLLIVPDAGDPVPLMITGNSFWALAAAINLGPNVLGTMITANMYRNNTWNILNFSTSPYNMITGSTPSNLPTWQLITGAVDNGAGLVRVTVSNTTSGFFNGQLVIVGGLGGIVGIDQDKTIATTVNVIDATHLDLNSVHYVGSYIGGGMISSLPP